VSARDYVLNQCKDAMLPLAFLEESVRETELVVRSKCENPLVAADLTRFTITENMLFAIVLFTFDLCLVAPPDMYSRENCFYACLNECLRRRDPQFLKQCHGYLYYLMTGLCRLPAFSANYYLYRGLDAAGAARARVRYGIGRTVHWSGFSSATPTLKNALDFARPDGLVLRIRVLSEGSKSRDIRKFSVLTHEDEVLLLPNFKLCVAEPAHRDAESSIDFIHLIELSVASTDVF